MQHFEMVQVYLNVWMIWYGAAVVVVLYLRIEIYEGHSKSSVFTRIYLTAFRTIQMMICKVKVWLNDKPFHGCVYIFAGS